jgi:hypothetical protein
VFRYRLHSPDGDDLGEATYAVMIKPGEEIVAGSNEHFHVVAVVSFDEEDESPFVGYYRSRRCPSATCASGYRRARDPVLAEGPVCRFLSRRTSFDPESAPIAPAATIIAVATKSF